ncbi:MAG TPA: hypothetical protein DEF07_10235 [Nitrosomonas sp.]|nr:hypothetical protein [Nitrosomonas sp.]
MLFQLAQFSPKKNQVLDNGDDILDFKQFWSNYSKTWGLYNLEMKRGRLLSRKFLSAKSFSPAKNIV